MNKHVVTFNSGQASKVPAAARKFIIVGVALVVLAVGIGVAWHVQTAKRTPPVPKNGTALTALYSGKISVNSSGATKLLQDEYNQATTKSEKIAVLQALYGAAMSKNDYKAAVAYLEQSRKLGDTSSKTLINLAVVYKDSLHDNAKALKYFRLAKTAVMNDKQNGTDPYAAKQEQYVDAQIKDLEAQGVR